VSWTALTSPVIFAQRYQKLNDYLFLNCVPVITDTCVLYICYRFRTIWSVHTRAEQFGIFHLKIRWQTKESYMSRHCCPVYHPDSKQLPMLWCRALSEYINWPYIQRNGSKRLESLIAFSVQKKSKDKILVFFAKKRRVCSSREVRLLLGCNYVDDGHNGRLGIASGLLQLSRRGEFASMSMRQWLRTSFGANDECF
jgi:hypothetical protein